MNIIVYDIEIAKAIQGRGEEKVEGIEYCKGWRDFEGMGIACICAYDYVNDAYRVFMEDNISEFIEIATQSQLVVGFNSYNFDNQLINEIYGIDLSDTTFDILREVWIAENLNPDKFNPRTHGGYGLDDMCKANFGTTKTGHGAKAPIDFQRGRYGSLIDYCLADVRLTKSLFDKIIHRGFLQSPKAEKSIIIDSPVDLLGFKDDVKAANKT